LLGSNHRELARALGRFDSLEQAAVDAVTVAAQAAGADIEVSVGPDSAWRWTMVVDGTPRAASSVRYARRLECLRAVARFRECAPTARVSPVPLIHEHPHDRARQHPTGRAPSRRDKPR
jgi:hypothetical protein